MTQEIIEMARDSGMELYGLGKDRARFVHHLEAFAKLVAEKALAEHAMRETQRLGQEIEQCQCPECQIKPHASDCAVHSEPAYPKGKCDCGAQPEQEPVAIKRMKEWVEYLKRKSDHGQHMKIPSEMSAGTCWELALELEQFINTTPPQRTWVGLTDDDKVLIKHDANFNQFMTAGEYADIVQQLTEARLKDLNT